MIKIKYSLLPLLIILCAWHAKSQDIRNYNAVRIMGEPPAIDGILDDSCWLHAEKSGGFRQYLPDEGQDPSQQTILQITYDDDHLYVGIQAYDTEPDQIVRRMSRRDGFEGDFISLSIDSYNDQRTAFVFCVSASGVKSDRILTGDGETSDDSWDAHWNAKAALNDSGWAAEIAIPFSQLRFNQAPVKEWGLQVVRRIFRLEERSVWQFIPRDAAGWISRFGKLHGIQNIRPPRRIDLSPFMLAKHQRNKPEPANPFAPGPFNRFNGGIDSKIGLSNDFTLDFSINPDFGQVEADPSEVNLTAFETYFPENRPFFIEGRDLFNFQVTGGEGGLSLDRLFYSRRIGSRPHHYPETSENAYCDVPENTAILGAMKISGKTRSGLSLGLLESFTRKEIAQIDSEGVRSEETVEPATNYLVATVRQDFNEGKTIIGSAFTSTNRFLQDFHQPLPSSAYTAGADVLHYWNDRNWMLSFRTVSSKVQGSKEAVLKLQESSLRYFQRPDASYVNVDSTRTGLMGHGGTLQVGKVGKGHWRYMSYLTWRSPGLELNDLGFLRQADDIMQAFWIGYRLWEPFSFFRTLNLDLSQWKGWNFGGEPTYMGGNVSASAQLINHWTLNIGSSLDGNGLSKSALRGGPSLKVLGGINRWIGLSTDSRRKGQVEARMYAFRGFENSIRIDNVYLLFRFRPMDALSFSLAPSWVHHKRTLHFVENIAHANDYKYINARINQTTMALAARFDLNITPDFSIQYYGQPFISSATFDQYKKIISPRAEHFEDRFIIFDKNQVFVQEDIIRIDENRDGLVDYSFNNPDFRFLQFRSNLVLRWEYAPGSVLYLVWSQGRTRESTDYGLINPWTGSKDLFDVYPMNVFLLKLAHRLAL